MNRTIVESELGQKVQIGPLASDLTLAAKHRSPRQPPTPPGETKTLATTTTVDHRSTPTGTTPVRHHLSGGAARKATKKPFYLPTLARLLRSPSRVLFPTRIFMNMDFN